MKVGDALSLDFIDSRYIVVEYNTELNKIW